MSLEVFKDGKQIFSSPSKWLHPLFELEEFLKKNPSLNPAELEVHDTVQGRAAAILTYRLGIRKVHADLASTLAVEFFGKHGIEFDFKTEVPKITCRTEELVSGNMTVDEAYNLLKKLAFSS